MKPESNISELGSLFGKTKAGISLESMIRAHTNRNLQRYVCSTFSEVIFYLQQLCFFRNDKNQKNIYEIFATPFLKEKLKIVKERILAYDSNAIHIYSYLENVIKTHHRAYLSLCKESIRKNKTKHRGVLIERGMERLRKKMGE